MENHGNRLASLATAYKTGGKHEASIQYAAGVLEFSCCKQWCSHSDVCSLKILENSLHFWIICMRLPCLRGFVRFYRELYCVVIRFRFLSSWQVHVSRWAPLGKTETEFPAIFFQICRFSGVAFTSLPIGNWELAFRMYFLASENFVKCVVCHFEWDMDTLFALPSRWTMASKWDCFRWLYILLFSSLDAKK